MEEKGNSDDCCTKGSSGSWCQRHQELHSRALGYPHPRGRDLAELTVLSAHTTSLQHIPVSSTRSPQPLIFSHPHALLFPPGWHLRNSGHLDCNKSIEPNCPVPCLWSHWLSLWCLLSWLGHLLSLQTGNQVLTLFLPLHSDHLIWLWTPPANYPTFVCFPCCPT